MLGLSIYQGMLSVLSLSALSVAVHKAMLSSFVLFALALVHRCALLITCMLTLVTFHMFAIMLIYSFRSSHCVL